LVLSNGWNLVSLPLQPTDTNILSVLAPIQGDYQAVWTYADGRWYVFNPSVPGLDDLKFMQAGKAYWIQMLHDGVLTVNGSTPVNAPNTLDGQKLHAGWNLLGFSSGRAEDISEVFAPVAGRLDLAASDSITGWLWYTPGKPGANTLGRLGAFRGVWAHVSANVTWTAPNFQGTLVDAITGKPVVGAIVTLDGIEAETPTDAQGAFLITGLSDDASQILTVAARGYVPLATTLNLAGANTSPLSLTPLPSPLVGEVLVPQNNSVWLQK
jgi:hypothetical protein